MKVRGCYSIKKRHSIEQIQNWFHYNIDFVVKKQVVVNRWKVRLNQIKRAIEASLDIEKKNLLYLFFEALAWPVKLVSGCSVAAPTPPPLLAGFHSLPFRR